MEMNNLTKICIGSAFEVHSKLGPGLLESAYKECLFYKIKKSGLIVRKEVPIPLLFEDVNLECGYRIDILVENSLVLEIKAVDQFNPIFMAQVLTYLRIGNFHLGLLLNFNVIHMREGIKRIIL
jgi:GxxExxY protein